MRVAHGSARSARTRRLPARLGRVHRDVGVAQQVVGARRRPARSAMPMLAPRATDVAPPSVDRLARAAARSLGDRRPRPGVADVLEQDRELVAAEPGRPCRRAGARRAQPLARPPRAAGRPRRARGVSLTVLKSSRSMNSTPTHRAVPARRGPARARARSVNRARLARPVSESWNAWWRELGLERLALGDVAEVDDDAADGRVVEQVAADRLDRPPRPSACLMRHSKRRSVPWPEARSASACCTCSRSSSWTSEANCRPSQSAARVAEDPFDGDALEPDPAVRVEDGLGVRRVLQQGAEARLAVAQVGGQPTSRRSGVASGRDVALNAPHSIRSSTVAASPGTMNTSRRVASMSSTIEVGVLVDLVGADDRAVRVRGPAGRSRGSRRAGPSSNSFSSALSRRGGAGWPSRRRGPP